MSEYLGQIRYNQAGYCVYANSVDYQEELKLSIPGKNFSW